MPGNKQKRWYGLRTNQSTGPRGAYAQHQPSAILLGRNTRIYNLEYKFWARGPKAKPEAYAERGYKMEPLSRQHWLQLTKPYGWLELLADITGIGSISILVDWLLSRKEARPVPLVPLKIDGGGYESSDTGSETGSEAPRNGGEDS